MNRIITPILLLLTATNLFACRQSISENELRYNTLFKNIEKTSPTSKSDCMISFAEEMLGTPYVSGTLENGKEELMISFDRTDCILFVESAVAFTQTFFSEEQNYLNYTQNVQRLRYRNGQITDYTSRIHYTSEWLKQAGQNGILSEITGNICKELGIGEYIENISFMSENCDKYPTLVQHPEMIPVIRMSENKLNQDTYYVIPKDRIRQAEKFIRNGDIIAFNTRIKGLDISHVGIAYWKNGELTFIHASSAKKEVIINEKSLSEYCLASRNCDGIRIARLTE